MITKHLSNEIMEKILNDSACRELSKDFQWTELMLEKHKNKVNWKELPKTICETILTEEYLEQFKENWDWTELSDNIYVELNYQLIDQLIDQWDWSKLINHWKDEKMYDINSLERYADKIHPANYSYGMLLLRTGLKSLKKEIIA
ncbi:hypothetical protein [Bacteroides sp.]|uniref:hypothetical protein n=1 Tax=Bacteroides sp. TaxID=29523 RepID=UPI002589D3DB|nr:hypothetical protein [Bacteroides sp.]